MKLLVDGPSGKLPAYAYTGGKPFDPALPCVVFVHGAGNDHSGFTLLARWFAHHGHAVLAVDLPGHMRSAGPLLPDVATYARWLLALLDAAGVQQAALVGHSMGSLIALEAAGVAPERASRLVMIGTAVPMKVSDLLLTAARERPLAAMGMVNTWSIASTASKPGMPGPGTWLHGAGLALMRRVQAAGGPGSNVFQHGFEVCNAYGGGLEAAARVRCPATLVLGRADIMTPPRATKELAAALKARVVFVASGHHPMAEAPDATLAAVREALA
ncbi:MAG: alpha/beta hydrolase [Burkholderiales bacterium]|nr:alpha/beta hydrolase [Burkholderiales bacterium]